MFAIAMMLSIITTTFANEIDNQSNTVVTIGYLAGYGGIRDIEAVSEQGYLYDMFERLSEYCDYTFEFKEYKNYYELVDAVNNNEIQYFGPLTDIAVERWGLLQCMNLTDSVVYLAKEKDDTLLYYNDFETINGKTIASYQDSSLETYLNEYCDTHGISVNYIRDSIDHYNELEADYYLVNSIDSKFDAYRSAINLKNLPLCMATAKENANAEFHKVLTKAFDEMLSSDIDFLHKLHSKYYGGKVSQGRTLTKKEVEMIQKSTYKVAFESGHDFFSYLNKEGVPDGMLINFFNELSKKFGVDIEYLPYRIHGEGENSQEYAIKNADIVLSSLGKYKDFRYDFSLSDTYFNSSFTVLVDKSLYYGNNQNTTARIGMLRNMFMDPNATDGLPFDASFTIYDDVSQLYRDFNDDKIDGLFISSCAMTLAKEKIERSYFNIHSEVNVPYKLWISNKLGHEYISIFDVMLDQMNPKVVEDLMFKEQEKYKASPNLGETIKANLPLVVILISAIVVGVMLIITLMQRSKQKKVKNLLEVDQLTGLMTISKMTEELANLLKTAKPNQYYILSLDIDDFKIINQTYGFEKGNELLCAIANSIKHYTSNDTLVCRLQNDVFILVGKSALLPNFSEDNFMISPKVYDDITKLVGINNIIHFSAGCCIIEDVHISIEKLVDDVRKARNISKLKHGNRITFYSEELKSQTEKEDEINRTMEKAIENKEFFIVIQPKVELETGKLVGGEVLVRWEKEDGRFIFPDEFIPLFEKNSFIITLDKYVFEETCQFVKNADVKLPHLSINVSLMTALSDNFIEYYMEILNRYELKPNQFELELTESAVDFDFEKIREISIKLKELGFTLSIDDFGKGASSLARINNLDVDVIKLDKGFITNNINKEKGNAVVANTISLASDLGITTLAEGIETKEQEELLIELGCDLGQGYLFDKPLSMEEFLKKADKDSKIDYPQVIKSKEKIKKYLNNYEDLPYGIAIVKNDPYSTVIKANRQFYDIIGHTKEDLYEKHKNRLTDILVDNLYYIIEEQDTTKDYNAKWDLRIKTADGDDVWVIDYVHYDALEDIFFITFIDATDKMSLNKAKLSFVAYQAQKESLLYMQDLTSDYIVVSDIETKEIVYANENTMKALGYSCEDDWIGKNYNEVTFGKNTPMHQDYYDMVLEKGYGSKEYYNEYLGRYLHNENKIITVTGRKMRLNIVTDITAKKKMESENNLQTTLKQCIEYLYATATTTTTTTFANMLEELKKYYYADRAYYYELDESEKTIRYGYEVLAEGIKSAKEAVLNLADENKEWLLTTLKTKNSIYQKKLVNLSDEEQNVLNPTYENHGVGSFIYASVKDSEENVIGFFGVDNPKENSDNPELMNLLSKYLWMFIKSMNTKVLEKEALQSEELSTVSTLEKGAVLLQGIENSDENITAVLSLLREHYGANHVTLFAIDKENSTYSMTHESCDSSTPSKFDESQKVAITSLEEWMRPYKNGAQFVSGNIEEMPVGSPQRKKWEKLGIKNVIIAPLFDQNNEITAFISVNNRAFIKRSQTLTCIIAKDISDYLEKIALEKRYEKEIALDPLTNLYNKIETQNTIKKLMGKGVTGVLFIIDIDYFKQLNDTLGHSVGDIALTELSAKIKKTFRSTDIVGRIGGDEFMVFCPNPIEDTLVCAKAESICNDCNTVYEKDEQLAEISTSIGILRIDEKGQTFKEVYEKVDKALYVAKNNGKNQYYIYGE